MTKLSKRDLEMFKLSCQMELALVADRLNMSLEAVHQRYYWIRQKRKEWQRNINILNNAEKMCPKLKKLLTPTDLKREKVARA